MLVLQRTKGEKIFIGEDITITLLGIEEGVASIGIIAPRCLPVFREEVYLARKRDLSKRQNPDKTQS